MYVYANVNEHLQSQEMKIRPNWVIVRLVGERYLIF